MSYENYPLAAIINFISDPTNKVVNDEWGWIKGVNHDVRKITILKNSGRGFIKENIFEIIASDIKTTSGEDVDFYKGRYAGVEFDFKELKLNLNMEGYRVRNETAIESYIILVFITSMLINMFLEKMSEYGKTTYTLRQYVLFPVCHIAKKLEEIQKDIEYLEYSSFIRGFQQGLSYRPTTNQTFFNHKTDGGLVWFMQMNCRT